jgi:threonine aldolase
LAEGLARLPGLKVEPPETNIVFVNLEHSALEATSVAEALSARGVWLTPYSASRLRMITHLDVDDEGIARAVAAFAEVVETRIGAAAR